MQSEGTPRKFSIGVIDDHRLFSQALKELLLSFDFIDEVQICVPHKTYGFQLPRKAFHLILIDVSMPYCNGFEAYKQLKASRPHQKIAFLSANEDKLSIQQAKKLEAHGYLLKSTGKEALVRAITTILVENKRYFRTPNSEASKGYELNGSHLKLTMREQKFLNTLIEEYLKVERMESENLSQQLSEEYKENLLQSIINGKITKQMSISKRAAQAYLKNLTEKLRTSNTIELVRCGMELFK